jgi:deazaflavin-dependent oxidoreductase (nitroreductase family)
MSDNPTEGRDFRRAGSSVSRGPCTELCIASPVVGVGLWRPSGNRWGTLRLTPTGRRTGRKHSVTIANFADGPNLIAMAMNSWADGEPAWWLNLQAHPDASVDLVDGPRSVRARVAKGDERSRLCGADGAGSTRSWTPMRRSGRPRPRW